jgi:hypothetical protein
MVLVRVRLVLGPLGPVPARGRHAHLRPPSRQKNTKSVMPGATDGGVRPYAPRHTQYDTWYEGIHMYHSAGIM